MPAFLVGLAVLPALLGSGCSQGPMEAVKSDRWSDAERSVAGAADPVSGKLITYFRLLAPRGGSAAEIGGFVAENAGWPNQAQLERRRQEALANEADQPTALGQCEHGPLQLAGALQRCAEAYTAAGRPDDAARAVRQAWTGGGVIDPGAEAAFLRRWGAVVMPDDQWQRFQALIVAHPDAAARQAARLDPAQLPPAQARLAFRRDDPAAARLAGALPDDPGLLLDQAAWLRRHDRLVEARDLWLARGEAAEQAAPREALPQYWLERNSLARKLLRIGDDRGAYALAAGHGPVAPEQLVEAEFLAGFIALRRLRDPATATRHFTALAASSGSAISQGRAHYWLARAEAGAGRSPAAEYEKAAAWPTTFYGQLAALALDHDPAALAQRVRAGRDPAWTRDQALDFGGTEMARASSLLAAWGDPRRAHAFLLRADEQAAGPPQRALAAHLAAGLGMPDMAVAIARRMGRDGLMLPEAGWPTPVEPVDPQIDAAIVLALIRQESSFDEQAISPSGARGLMQLMPATALAVARQLGAATSLAALTDDPKHNMRLGTAYLRGVLVQFGNSLPLAYAAYNAGPSRVQEWLAVNGDPRGGASGNGVDMVDWIELIPISETRNYVQRVMENAVAYRSRLGTGSPVLLATWPP